MIDALFDLSNVDIKQDLLRAIGSRKGVHRVIVKKHVPKRTNPQNAYFHGVVVKAFFDYWTEEQTFDNLTEEETKNILKGQFLKETKLLNEETGEYAERIRDTSKLSKEEMSIFIQQCIDWGREFFGIIIPPPNYFKEVSGDEPA